VSATKILWGQVVTVFAFVLLIAAAVAIGMSVWRVREAKNAETYGSARWAQPKEIEQASGQTACCWGVTSEAICATMDRSTCCALHPRDRAKVSVSSSRRC
jgi:hypothetical protein